MKGIEGSTLGRYELRRRVAQGGMSEVYLGYDRRVKRNVAIKVLYGGDKPLVRRFEREALAVGTLSHDHILPLYDFGEQRPWYYLVMPYIEGGTLRDYLLNRERLLLEEAGSFLSQIAAALQYAHEHGVIHRDVKPSNILLRPDGYIYLVDFGLAKAKREGESPSHSGMMIGTPEYMAPELSNGISDYRSDIYSLGIILYQMLTGRVPFSGDSPMTTLLQHIQARPIPPSQLNSDIPPTIEAVILKALAKDPNERYQYATALSAAYNAALRQVALYDPTKKGLLPIREETDEPTLTKIEAMPTIQTQILHPPEQTFTLNTKRASFALLKEGIPPSSALPEQIDAPRQPFHQIVLIAFCLLLLGISITLGSVWQTHNSTSLRLRRTGFQAQLHMTATASAQVKEQATLAAQARAQATAGITTGIDAGDILYANALTRAGYGWINDGSQCYFSPQGYHVYTNLRHTVVWCYYNPRSFADVVITAQAQLLRGEIYGVIFRLNPSTKSFYILELNYAGAYRLIRAQGSNPLNWLTLIDWTSSPAIIGGYGQINTFLIETTGAHMRCYINRQLIIPDILDDAYPMGRIGFLVGGDNNSTGTEAIFSNIWVFQK